jgi:hypothetical protein
MPLGMAFSWRERSSLGKDGHTHGEAFPTTLRRICRDGCVKPPHLDNGGTADPATSTAGTARPSLTQLLVAKERKNKTRDFAFSASGLSPLCSRVVAQQGGEGFDGEHGCRKRQVD